MSGNVPSTLAKMFETRLLAAASGELSLATVIPLLIGAALLGDQVNYFIGNTLAGSFANAKKSCF